MLAAGEAAIFDPAREAVFVCDVISGGVENGGWRVEADALPFEAAVDGPLQDAGPFLAQLIGEVAIALVGRDCNGERDQVDAPSDCLIDAGKRRPVVSGIISLKCGV